MFFRNITFFRLPTTLGTMFETSLSDELDSLHEHLKENALQPVGPYSLCSQGFVRPLGRNSEAYTHRVDAACHITLGSESKILPTSVINDQLQKRLADLEKREGRAPTARTRKRLRQELVEELLPRAFAKPGRVDAWFDFDRGFLAIDTTSRRLAESLVSHIRYAVGSFPALPLAAETAPRVVLTGWLAGEDLPPGFKLGVECELHDPADTGAVAKIQGIDLHGEEVAKHLEAGMHCTRLELVWQERLSFVLGEDLVLRKLRFLDAALESLEGLDPGDVQAELDARFALMAGEIGQVFDVLAQALKLSAVDPDAPTPAPRKAPLRDAAEAAKRLATMAADQGVTMDMVLPDGETVRIGGPGADDPLYEQARHFVLDQRNASISRLQRLLKVGYNRAARLIEALQDAGVVSVPDERGDRQVLHPEGSS